MHRVPFLAVLLSLALTLGITPAQAATPTRGQVITGQVVDSDGHPIRGLTVFVEDEALLQGLFGLLACAFNPFVALIDGVCFPHSTEGTTDATGHYRVLLPAGSALAKPGLRQLRVIGRAAAAGLAASRFSGSFSLTRSTRGLPTARLWTRTATQTHTAGSTEFTLTPPAGTSKASAVLRADAAQGLAYAPVFKDFKARLDDRVLEQGTRSLDGSATGTWADHDASWGSASTAVPTYGRPVSRGRHCSTYAKGGALVDYPGCPFTDGQLSVSLGLLKAVRTRERLHTCTSGSDCASPNSLVVDLGALHVARAVVWRDCTFCSVQLSVDGQHWTGWPAQVKQGFTDATITGAAVATRYVRVRGDVFQTWDLREISLWADPLLPALPVLAGERHEYVGCEPLQSLELLRQGALGPVVVGPRHRPDVRDATVVSDREVLR